MRECVARSRCLGELRAMQKWEVAIRRLGLLFEGGEDGQCLGVGEGRQSRRAGDGAHTKAVGWVAGIFHAHVGLEQVAGVFGDEVPCRWISHPTNESELLARPQVGQSKVK